MKAEEKAAKKEIKNMDEKNMEPRSNVIEVDIQKEMQKSFLDSSMSVIDSG